MQLPDVRAAFLAVMSSLVAGPVGARFMLAQFSASASKVELEHLTWRTLFRTLVGYCARWVALTHSLVVLSQLAAGSNPLQPARLYAALHCIAACSA